MPQLLLVGCTFWVAASFNGDFGWSIALLQSFEGRIRLKEILQDRDSTHHEVTERNRRIGNGRDRYPWDWGGSRQEDKTL